jgi:hypothetical protein
VGRTREGEGLGHPHPKYFAANPTSRLFFPISAFRRLIAHTGLTLFFELFEIVVTSAIFSFAFFSFGPKG